VQGRCLMPDRELSPVERDAMESALKNALAILPSDYVRSGTPYLHMWRAAIAYERSRDVEHEATGDLTCACGGRWTFPSDLDCHLRSIRSRDAQAVEQRHVEQQAADPQEHEKIQMYNLAGEVPHWPSRLLAWPDFCTQVARAEYAEDRKVAAIEAAADMEQRAHAAEALAAERLDSYRVIDRDLTKQMQRAERAEREQIQLERQQAKLRQFAEFVVALDMPEARSTRQTISLTKLIDQARAALAATTEPEGEVAS